MRKTIVLLIALVSVSTCYGQTAEEYYEQGLEKYHAADYRGAIRSLNKSIQLDPNHADAYNKRGNSKLRAFNQDFRGAMADYSKFIELEPMNPKGYFNRGLVRSTLEDYDRAIEDFTEAIKLDPNYTIAYKERGDAKKLMGNKEGALADYEAATEMELKEKASVAEIDTTQGTEVVESIEESMVVKDSKNMVVDLSAFTTVEKDINYAGLQLQNARKTFGVGFFLGLLGSALATGGYFAKNPKVQTGLVVAGGVTSLVGSVVMITAVIPIGGAGKILQGVRFPKTLPVKVE